MNAYATDELRYDAVKRRDPRADDVFLYAVVTTGVYCRPSCPSRLARFENVGFHPTADAAERAGYRPCKRCRPREPSLRERHAAIIEAARRMLDEADGAVALADVAERVGLSAFHFHRLFTRAVGMTPRAYAAASRLARARRALAAGTSVTSALHDAGYGSSSRFYAAAPALGMSPTALRRGGRGVSMRVLVRSCALGQLLVAVTARGVCALTLGDDADALRDDLRARFPLAEIVEASGDGDGREDLEPLAAAAVRMIESPELADALPLDLVGTAFQQRVWRALREVPAGETVTYAELARRIGAPAAIRAVGSACARNPVAVAVPCHRVLRSNGDLGGYRWGLSRKRALLEREKRR